MSTKNFFTLENLLKCEGYIPTFINSKKSVSLANILNTEHKKQLPKVRGTTTGLLRYRNLSIAYHSARKLPFYAAYNIDGLQKNTTIRKGNFRIDPRIADSLHLSDDFYKMKSEDKKNIFEKGHMAAYKEMCWGDDLGEKAYLTFFFPNCAPQSENLNTGIWSRLENYILAEISELGDQQKISVFTGPILSKKDPHYLLDPDFSVPLFFYKIIVFGIGNMLYSTAFVMSHEKKLIEKKVLVESPQERAQEVPSVFSDFKYKKVFQVNIDLLEQESGLNFSWKNVKKIKIENDINQLKIIRSVSNVGDISGRNQSLTSKLNIVLPS